MKTTAPPTEKMEHTVEFYAKSTAFLRSPSEVQQLQQVSFARRSADALQSYGPLCTLYPRRGLCASSVVLRLPFRQELRETNHTSRGAFLCTKVAPINNRHAQFSIGDSASSHKPGHVKIHSDVCGTSSSIFYRKDEDMKRYTISEMRKQ